MAPVNFDRQKLKTKLLDDSLLPTEIAKLLEDDDKAEFPFAIRSLLASGEVPVSYVRERWSEDANYYTANRGARRLIVAFCNHANRLGVPISYFLQMLREDLYDVVVLRDPRKLHFNSGVQGIGSFLETMRRIKGFAECRGYQEVITYGASTGGYPALRAGLLLNANRAISVSGGYCWHVGRLLRKSDTIGAFDSLCPCVSKSATQLVAVVPAKNEQDMAALATLRLTFPECLPVTFNIEMHNITQYFYQVRLVRLFYACLFEYWDRTDIRAGLLTIIDQSARQGHDAESRRVERERARVSVLHQRLIDTRQRHLQQVEVAQKRHLGDLAAIERRHQRALEGVRRRHAGRLETLYRSKSWLLTKPLRILVEAVRRLMGLQVGH